MIRECVHIFDFLIFQCNNCHVKTNKINKTITKSKNTPDLSGFPITQLVFPVVSFEPGDKKNGLRLILATCRQLASISFIVFVVAGKQYVSLIDEFVPDFQAEGTDS